MSILQLLQQLSYKMASSVHKPGAEALDLQPGHRVSLEQVCDTPSNEIRFQSTGF